MASTAEPTTATAPTAAAPATTSNNVVEPLVEPAGDDELVEVEDEEDSAFGGSTSQSDWTSVSSSIYKGVIENGRRYQSLKEGEYWGPADDQQFESMANNHLANLLHDQGQENQYFRSPIGDKATHILDIGTGDAAWAVDVADKFPHVTVYGVDLSPPPETWVPPNCILEVDDITRPWTWTHKFDLVHLRWMAGAFSEKEWDIVYRQAYKNLKPGAWIEHADVSVVFECDDGSIPPDSVLGGWGEMFLKCAAKMGKYLNTVEMMRTSIEKAGFTNVHEKNAKFPVGTWPKNPVHKEVGRVQLSAAKLGIEGYAMFLLTTFGEPEPWSPEQVQVFLMQMRKDLDNKAYHPYQRVKRVWAQKPFEEKSEAA